MVSIFTVLSLLGIATFFSLLFEGLLQPRPALLLRPLTAIFLHVLITSFLFLLVILVFQRPVFATLVVLVTFAIFVIVSNAKYQALREPLVYSDIAMFSQAFKHPRLYLPFLGWMPVIVAPLVVGGLIFVIIKYEPAMRFSGGQWLALIASLLVVPVLIRYFALRLQFSLKPGVDIQKYGLLACLSGYFLQARTPQHKQQIKEVLQASAPSTMKRLESGKPNIIAIQSESFFDARRLSSAIEPSVLKHFDQLCEESLYHGSLNVPAWGANTMRTECSFLTGISCRKLGFYQFYPYQYLKDQSIPSLASYLRQQGYYCVCIHPHPASFFGRKQMFPNMGFDEFIDCESFDKSQTFGPYLSDQAVTHKIIETLEKQDKPVFIFAITMENHGPLHLEKTTAQDIKNLYRAKPPVKHNDLTVYLRHLKNADQMLAELRTELSSSTKESALCFYGDHIPSMPTIYQTLAYENEQTDYLIWHSKKDKRKAGGASMLDLDVEKLCEYLVKGTK